MEADTHASNGGGQKHTQLKHQIVGELCPTLQCRRLVGWNIGREGGRLLLFTPLGILLKNCPSHENGVVEGDGKG